MKRIHIASVLCICLLFCCLGMMPGERVRADSIRLTSKAVTIVKGQYAFIGLKGIDSKVDVTWSVEGENIKLHKSGNDSAGMQPYCYIKAVKTGSGTLKCKVNKKTLKCKVKIVDKSSFIGDFSDDAGEVYLDIFKSGKKYVAFYRQFRLAQLDWLQGTVKNGILILEGIDPAGKPITVTVSRKGSKRIFTFKETTWEYFTQGSTITLKKCSGKDGYENALSGYGQ